MSSEPMVSDSLMAKMAESLQHAIAQKSEEVDVQSITNPEDVPKSYFGRLCHRLKQLTGSSNRPIGPLGLFIPKSDHRIQTNLDTLFPTEPKSLRASLTGDLLAEPNVKLLEMLESVGAELEKPDQKKMAETVQHLEAARLAHESTGDSRLLWPLTQMAEENAQKLLAPEEVNLSLYQRQVWLNLDAPAESEGESDEGNLISALPFIHPWHGQGEDDLQTEVWLHDPVIQANLEALASQPEAISEPGPTWSSDNPVPAATMEKLSTWETFLSRETVDPIIRVPEAEAAAPFEAEDVYEELITYIDSSEFKHFLQKMNSLEAALQRKPNTTSASRPTHAFKEFTAQKDESSATLCYESLAQGINVPDGKQPLDDSVQPEQDN